MQELASGAMAIFCIQRPLAAELVLDTTAMAATFVEGFEVGVGGVNAVRCALLPLVVLYFGFAFCGMHDSRVCSGCSEEVRRCWMLDLKDLSQRLAAPAVKTTPHGW